MTKGKVAKAAKAKKVENLNKQFMLSAARVIAEKIQVKKLNSNGRVPWGFAATLLKQGKEIYPKLSMRTINNYVIKLERGKLSGSTISLSSSTLNLSDVTNPSSMDGHKKKVNQLQVITPILSLILSPRPILSPCPILSPRPILSPILILRGR